MKPNIPVNTIDGPSGVGKGTLSQALAKTLNWHLLDSGAIYRVLAVAALKHQLDLNDEYQLAQLAEQLDLRFIAGQQAVQVWLANEEVSDTIRLQQSGETASKIAVYPAVRQALLARQRAF